MAKASVVLWKHKADAQGHYPVYLRFTETGRTLYKSLRVSMAARHWNEKSPTRPVRKGHPQADEINALISARLAVVEVERLRLLTAGEPVTAAALKASLAVQRQAVDPCFFRYVEDFLVSVEKSGNVQRVDKERSVIAKLRAWVAGVPSGKALRALAEPERAAAEKKAAAARLPISRLTSSLLQEYAAHLIGDVGNAASTVKSNMNVVRLHARRAMRDGLITRDADPFFNYTPPREVRVKRARLTQEEIDRMGALDLGPRGPSGSLAARVRDVFLFALYGAGIRFGDLTRLRMRDLQPASDGSGAVRLAYTAGKTGKRTSAPLVEPAMLILAPYLVQADGSPKAPNDYLLPILDGVPGGAEYDLSTPRGMDRAVASQNALHNKTLKRIAKLADLPPTLSMHVARHSFADLARRDGWSVYDVKQALRHSSVATTEQYLAGFDSEALDKRIGALFGGAS